MSAPVPFAVSAGVRVVVLGLNQVTDSMMMKVKIDFHDTQAIAPITQKFFKMEVMGFSPILVCFSPSSHAPP